MPSKSKAQRNFMAAAAHNPAFAKKVGIPAKVAKEFNQADKGKKFVGGGMAKENSKMDMAQDKKTVKKAIGMHDKQMHGGKKTDLADLKKGGSAKMADGGITKAIAGAAKNAMNNMMTSKAPTPPTATPTKGGMLGGLRGSKPPSMLANAPRVSVPPRAPAPSHTIGMGSTGGPAASMARMKKGGCTKMAKGGGIEVRGKTRGKMV